MADGKIVALASGPAISSREEIDATGLHIFPGVIDAHVHFNEPGRADWEGIETGSRALAAGGGTTFFDMPLNAHPPTVDAASFDLKLQAAQCEFADGFRVLGRTGSRQSRPNGGTGRTRRDWLQGLHVATAASMIFTAWMTRTLREGMKRAAQLKKIVAVHAESETMTRELTQQRLRAGKTTIRDYLDSRPDRGGIGCHRTRTGHGG